MQRSSALDATPDLGRPLLVVRGGAHRFTAPILYDPPLPWPWLPAPRFARSAKTNTRCPCF